MAGDADEELLARLGVVAADTSEYERGLLAQVEQQAQQTSDPELEEHGEQNVEAALRFLQEDDTEVRARKDRICGILAKLEKEIEAVTSGRDGFSNPGLTDEKSGGAKTGKKTKREEFTNNNGEEAMHLALLDERLEALKWRKKNLTRQLKLLEKPAQESRKDHGKAEIQQEKGSTLATKQGKGHITTKSTAVTFVEDDDFDAVLDAASGFVETERERLIRMGVITPFSKVDGLERQVRSRTSERALSKDEDELVKRSIANAAASMSSISKARPSTKLLDNSELPKLEPPTREFRHLGTPFKRVTADEGNEKPAKSRSNHGVKRKRPQADKKWRTRVEISSDDESNSLGNLTGDVSDDSPVGKAKRRKRLRQVSKTSVEIEDGTEAKRDLKQEKLEDEQGELEDDSDAVLEGGLKVPGSIYNNLFDYQKTGVKWMWELHCQKAGGIIGDEMGLGKTIQVISFLAALHYSGLYSPSIVICPVTLLRQWMREVKKWYPPFEAWILHDSAVKGHLKKSRKKKIEQSEETTSSSGSEKEENKKESEIEGTNSSVKGLDRWTAMINRIVQSESGLLITTYEQLRINRDKLLDINWGYAVLDEGHRVRNPDAEITLVCKQVQTVHRIIMTGAPIQNRLTELWSLFDFVFPGKLGVLPVFQAQFALPIQIGGYANATPLQVSTAYKCAVVLRDLILPYLLRRMKADVNANLTKKTEHVLFCSLSKEQRAAYRAFLGSSEVEQIMEGNRNSLFGIDILRKICNHPDLLEREHSAGHADYGNPERSGKLKLVLPILNLWKSQGHRVLMFTQTQQMLDILQNLAESQGFEYRRMDGCTAVKHRMALIDEFNESEHVFLFILTTKVGGLGTNLIGANRVIIFDPDWNPSTDMQARERAWRIGQKKDVTIYRLITRGTIEEKVYHRQIYKHFLTNKILKDPQQRRIFKARDMRDLFILQEDTNGDKKTETATLFGDDVGDLIIHAHEANTLTEVVCETNISSSKSGEWEIKTMLGQEVQSNNSDVNSGEDKTQEEESRILKNLFDANGIHSAMDHDAILAVSEKEKVTVDQEAGRVAQRAANALLQSRMLRSSDNIAVPTWTGRSGEAGAPAGVRRRFGSTTNSRLVTSVAQTVTMSTVQSQVRSVQQVPVDHSTISRQVAGIGAGSAAGRALSSSDVLSRMRERRMGALGAGLESAYSSSCRSAATAGANRFGRGAAVMAQSDQGSPSAGQGSKVPVNRFGRGLTSVPSETGKHSQILVHESGNGTGLTNNSSGCGPDSQSGQIDVPATPLRFGRGIATPPTQRQGSQSSTLSFGRGSGSNRGSGSLGQVIPIQQGHPHVLLAEIKTFLKHNGGTVPSATIVEHFQARIPSKDISLFRQLLKEAASLQKGVGEVSRWVLKSETSGVS